MDQPIEAKDEALEPGWPFASRAVRQQYAESAVQAPNLQNSRNFSIRG
jgi:hypothetical protein